TDLTQDDFVKDDFTQNNSAKDGGAQDDFMQDSLEKNAVNTASAKPPENEWADGFKTSDFKATDFKATDFKATDFKENGFNANGFKTSDFELGDFNAKDLNFGSKVSPVNDLQQDNQWAALFSDTTTNSKTSTAIPSEPSQTSLSAQLDKAGLGDESSGGNHHDSHHGNHHANHSFTHLAFDDVARDGMMERLQNGAQASSVQSSRSFVNQFTDKSIEQSTASTSKADDDYVAMMTQQIATMLTHCAQAQQAVDVVLLCGSGRALDGLCAGVAKQTSKQTLIANPLAGVDFMQACAQVQADAPQLMALFGLAMRACDDS
ncbi:pilus assembly protein PilM, partial [Moraxella caviae]